MAAQQLRVNRIEGRRESFDHYLVQGVLAWDPNRPGIGDVGLGGMCVVQYENLRLFHFGRRVEDGAVRRDRDSLGRLELVQLSLLPAPVRADQRGDADPVQVRVMSDLVRQLPGRAKVDNTVSP